MWCPCCQSESPMVAIHDSGLICAHCHVEVEAVRPIDGTLEFSPADVSPVNLPNQAAGQKLFRFDPPHHQTQPEDSSTPNRSNNSTSIHTLSPALSASDSPQLLTLVLLFFVGQALIVWAFFQANVQALGIGLVTSISAVGLALQSVNRTEMIRRAVERRTPKTSDKLRRTRPRTSANAHQRLD
jgi:hypothetical protein